MVKIEMNVKKIALCAVLLLVSQIIACGASEEASINQQEREPETLSQATYWPTPYFLVLMEKYYPPDISDWGEPQPTPGAEPNLDGDNSTVLFDSVIVTNDTQTFAASAVEDYSLSGDGDPNQILGFPDATPQNANTVPLKGNDFLIVRFDNDEQSGYISSGSTIKVYSPQSGEYSQKYTISIATDSDTFQELASGLEGNTSTIIP